MLCKRRPLIQRSYSDARHTLSSPTMRVLIVEDDALKLAQLAKFAAEELPAAVILQRHSYQSGLEAVMEELPDIVLLDMTLPNFDISATEAGYSTEFFAGRDILREITRYELSPDVIVVTQFEQFGKSNEITTLDELKKQLASQFPKNYIATVYYHPARDDWKTQLRQLLAKYKSAPLQ
jgi:DNA-binding NarL/FixJ family response regulator